MLSDTGAFRLDCAIKNIMGQIWTHIAFIDYMVELGEIIEITHNVGTQNRVFIKAR